MIPSEDLRRRITRLIAFRVGWVTILLGAIVIVHALSATAADLDRPFLTFLFRIVLATYAFSLIYAVWLPRSKNLLRFASVQMIIDLGIATAIVHATGGASSGLVLIYLLTIVGSAMICERVGEVLATAGAATTLYIGVSYLGYTSVIPPISGQLALPSALSAQELWRALVINLSALVGVTVLATSLVSNVRRVGERVAQARAYAEDTKALHQDILRSLTTGLITADLDRTVLSFNPGAARMLQLASAEALMRKLSDFAPELDAVLVAASSTEGAKQVEIRMKRRDGQELAVGIVVAPLFDRGGLRRGSILHLEDRTTLRRVEADAARNEQLATVGRFAAGVAHEFRNPLGAISGSIELLKTTALAGDDDKRLMEIVIHEVERLDRLVAGLLEYARPREAGSLVVDLADLVRDVVLIFENEFHKDGDKERIPAVILLLESTSVRVDPDQFRQVLWNLLRNAAESMSGSGEIQISTRPIEGNGLRLAELRVMDEGVGIAAQDLGQIFEPFFSTKPRGTGLGLATVHQIVRAHGGSIFVKAREDGERGTTVVIQLALANQCDTEAWSKGLRLEDINPGDSGQFRIARSK